ncbi:MAG: hypothetical protein J5636_05500 [Clostridiales bacterium]|nr:hypothetical protein [Clostridiales bacterium]
MNPYEPENQKIRFLSEIAIHILDENPRVKLPRFFFACEQILGGSDSMMLALSSAKARKTGKDVLIDAGIAVFSDLLPGGDNTFSFIAEKVKDLHRDKKQLSVIEPLKNRNPEKLKEMLHRLFFQDIKDAGFFPSLSSPFVIFLDDFERFIRPSGLEASEKDTRWLSEFMCALPNILWVIVGRDEINWDAYVGNENRPIDISLEAFKKPEYVQEFFDHYSQVTSMPSIKPELAEYIWELTKGIPLYLQICLESYDNAENKEEISKEIFGKDIQMLLDRFYNNYTAEQKNAMSFLCCLPDEWTENMAFLLFARIKDKDRYGLLFNQSTFDTLTPTSAFTHEGLTYRIHEAVRRSVLQSAKPFEKEKRLKAILDAQVEYAEQLEDHQFWQKAFVFRENVCRCWDIWAETHEGAREIIAEAKMSCGNNLIKRADFEIETNTLACEYLKDAIALLKTTKGEDSWEVLEALDQLAFASFISNHPIETILNECIRLIKTYHSKEWIRSAEYVYDLWASVDTPDGVLIQFLEEILGSHDESKMTSQTLEIVSGIKAWHEKQKMYEDSAFWEAEKEAAKEFESDNLRAQSDAQSQYSEFLLERDSHAADYSEEECKYLEKLISTLGFQYMSTEATDVADTLYLIYKNQNHGRDDEKTVGVLLQIADILEREPDIGSDLIDYRQRIYDILTSGEEWTVRFGIGRAVLELARLKERCEEIEESLKYYRELLEHFQEYQEDLDDTTIDELETKVQELEDLMGPF